MLEVRGDQPRRRQSLVTMLEVSGAQPRGRQSLELLLEVGGGQVKAGRLLAKTSSWMVSLDALVSIYVTDCF
jgi:hypothetical protein